MIGEVSGGRDLGAMRVYFAGVGGVGIGPLAIFASEAGLEVFGSDLAPSFVSKEVAAAGVEVRIGQQAQNGEYLRYVQRELLERDRRGLDWFVYTSALPEGSAELVAAREIAEESIEVGGRGLKISKRDDFLQFLVEELGLKMLAMAGTHGKTTSTAMVIWVFHELGLPLNYLVGTTLGFGPSAKYSVSTPYIAYECDEYDRNFLKFSPEIAVIPSLDYDHPDTFATEGEYLEAFREFVERCKRVVTTGEVVELLSSSALVQPRTATVSIPNPGLTLAGEHNRMNATLVLEMLKILDIPGLTENRIVDALNRFPGSDRRFERLADGVYTDYAHHPREIKATLQMARELGRKVAVVYQPHQNTRQHQVRDEYHDAFMGTDKVFWLPTYLVREDENLPVLTPSDLIAGLDNAEVAETAELDDELIKKLKKLHRDGYNIVLMTAGPADGWLRNNVKAIAGEGRSVGDDARERG